MKKPHCLTLYWEGRTDLKTFLLGDVINIISLRLQSDWACVGRQLAGFKVFLLLYKTPEVFFAHASTFTLALPMALRACDCSCRVMWETESATTRDRLWNMCSTACRQTYTARLTSRCWQQATSNPHRPSVHPSLHTLINSTSRHSALTEVLVMGRCIDMCMFMVVLIMVLMLYAYRIPWKQEKTQVLPSERASYQLPC